jgi:hypothetical protein
MATPLTTVHTGQLSHLSRVFDSASADLSYSGRSLGEVTQVAGSPFGQGPGGGSATRAYAGTRDQLTDLTENLGSLMAHHRDALLTASNLYGSTQDESVMMIRAEGEPSA